jgi:hypothetical protein
MDQETEPIMGASTGAEMNTASFHSLSILGPICTSYYSTCHVQHFQQRVCKSLQAVQGYIREHGKRTDIEIIGRAEVEREYVSALE